MGTQKYIRVSQNKKLVNPHTLKHFINGYKEKKYYYIIMGRKKMVGQEGYIKCKVCDRNFKIKNKMFEYPFTHYINEQLADYLDDLTFDDYELAKHEDFFKHLHNERQICPGAICTTCESTGTGYKLFETRQQKRYHFEKLHDISKSNDVVGKTGFTDRIRKEVLYKTNEIILQMKADQKNWKIQMPTTIEVKIDGWKVYKIDEMEKQIKEEKKTMRQKKKEIRSKQRVKNDHNETLDLLNKQLKAHGLDTV